MDIIANPIVERQHLHQEQSRNNNRFLYYDDGGGGSYIHIDRSDDFRRFEGFLLLLAWILLMVAIGRARKPIKGWMALSSGVIMVLLDFLLQWLSNSSPCPLYGSSDSGDYSWCSRHHGNSNAIYYFRAKDQLPTEPIVFLFAMAVFKAVLQDYFPSFVDKTLRRGNDHSSSPPSLSCTSRLLQSFLTQSTYLSLLDAKSTFLRSFVAGSILTQDTYLSFVGGPSSNESNTDDGEEAREPPSYQTRTITEFLQGVGSSVGSALTVNGNIHSLLIASYFAYDHISWVEYTINMSLPILTILLLMVTLVVVGVVLTIQFGRGNLLGFIAATNTSTSGHYEGLSTIMSDDADNTCTFGTPSNTKEQLSPTARTIILDGEDDDMESSPTSVAQNFELESTTIHPLGTDNDENPNQHSLSAFWVVVGAISILVLGYAMDYGVPVVALTVTLALFGVGQCFFAVDNSNEANTPRMPPAEGQQGLVLAGKLDLEPILSYCGIATMTLVLDDTGMPQAFYALALGTCAEQLGNGICVYQSGLVMYFQATVISPLATAFMLAGTFPYLSPLDWIRATFCLSMAVIGRTLIKFAWSRRKMYTSKAVKWVCVVAAVIVPMPCVAMGLHIISVVSFAPECSERLGECAY